MKWTTNIWGRMRDTWSYRHEPEHLRKLADTYWRALLLATTFIILSATLYGSLKLFAVLRPGEGGAILLLRSGGGAALNRVELQATLDGFAARKERYESLKNNRPKIIDPSK